VPDRQRASTQQFGALHASGTFVIPNPWDLGSARLLVSLGFKALATTSAGFAWSTGRSDNHITLDDALSHIWTIASGVDVPINADFEGGFALDPQGVAANVSRACDTGIAGLSIEDATGDPCEPLFAFGLAVERIAAARGAIDRSGTGVLLTARTEGFVAGRPDLDETLRRLRAFSQAGADCLYAPGIRTTEQITAVVQAVAPRPVNVLANGPFTTVAALEQLGVRRISVGGTLARTAWAGFLTAAREIAAHGTFDALATAVPGAEMNAFFSE